MYGPDVSNNQGPIAYPTLFAKGKPDLLIAKASEGTGFRDGYFGRHRTACAGAGVPFGAYHFARPDKTSPLPEADHFCQQIGSLRPGELRPALDMETGPATRAWALAFCQRVEQRLGVKPLLYTYPDYLRRLGGWPAGDLWIANLVSPGHSSIPNVLQQYDWHHRVPGISGEADYNYTADLRALLAHPTPELTAVQERFMWYRWRLGEGEFKPYGPHNAEHRPTQVRAQIPAAWWKQLKAFLAARERHPASPGLSTERRPR